LAFLFFAITSLHQKLKKQSTAPVQVQRAIHRRDEPDSESFLSPGGRRATRKIYFLAKKLVLFAKFETLSEKIFSSIAHNRESSKNYFAAKRLQTGSKRRDQDALDRDHRKESSLDLIIRRHSGVECGGRGEKLETHGETQERSARRRVVTRAVGAGRNRFDELIRRLSK